MASKFSISEVVELGVQIEINGKDFYETLVLKTKSEKARAIFEFLKDEEEKHIETFRKILDSVHKYEPKEAYPDEYFSYMNFLASEHVFTKKGKGVEMAQNASTDVEGVDLGIKFEKDSILFYEGMKKIVADDEKGTIDLLIKEEENHYKKLTHLKKEL